MGPARSWCRLDRSCDGGWEARGAIGGTDSSDSEGAGRPSAAGATAADWKLHQAGAMFGDQRQPFGECGDAVAPYEGVGDCRTGSSGARGEVCKLSAAAGRVACVYGAVG